jgi:threonine/homoserine/homoserine lactone efflux protein
MSTSLLYLFLPACLALSVAPGPSNLLALGHGTRHGFGSAVLAGSGRLLAFTGMLALVSLGLAAVLNASEAVFHGIRFAGIAFLAFLAWRLWRRRPHSQGHATAGQQARSVLRMARNEFVLAAGNPKVLVLFTALAPQFIDTSQPAAPQFLVLAGLFLAVEWLVIAAYAGAGVQLRHLAQRPGPRRLLRRLRHASARPARSA